MSVTEPTYQYVKGQGWVPSVETWHYATLEDGTAIRFIYRLPKKGEYWICSHKFAPRSPESWKKKMRTYGSFDVFDPVADDDFNDDFKDDATYEYIVVERV
jgi:hypothetical protein